jgi:hypothetical protein
VREEMVAWVAVMIEARSALKVAKILLKPSADEVPVTVEEAPVKVLMVSALIDPLVAARLVDEEVSEKKLVVVAFVMVARVALRSVRVMGFAVVKVPET